jgi:hypothetical protein
VVLVFLAIGLAIWCSVDIHRRGQIVGGSVHLHMTDFTVYTEAGAAFFDGRDPYAVANPRGWKYLYPPLLALIVAPLAGLDSQTQVCIWFFISSLLAVVCFREVRALWRTIAVTDVGAAGRAPNSPPSWRDPAPWLGLCAAAAVLPPMLHDLQRGQVGLLLLYPLLLGTRLILGRRPGRDGFLGGLVLSFPVVIKLYPIVPVGFLVWQRWVALPIRGWERERVRSALGVTSGVLAGTFLFVLMIPSTLVGWGENLRHLDAWKERVVMNQDRGTHTGIHVSSFHNQSFHNASYWLRASLLDDKPADQYWAAFWQRHDQALREKAWAVRGMVLMLLIVAGMALVALDEGAGTGAAFGLSCSVPLIVSPIAWSHYYSILLPALVFLPHWMLRQGLRASAVLAALGPGVLLWVHYLHQSWAGPLGLLGVGITTWYLAVGLRILAATASLAAKAQTRVTAPGLEESRRTPPAWRHDPPSSALGHHDGPARVRAGRPRPGGGDSRLGPLQQLLRGLDDPVGAEAELAQEVLQRGGGAEGTHADARAVQADIFRPAEDRGLLDRDPRLDVGG